MQDIKKNPNKSRRRIVVNAVIPTKGNKIKMKKTKKKKNYRKKG